MNETEIRSAIEYTFDTCVGVKMCQNPNFGSVLKCHLNLENSVIHLCSQTILEAGNLAYDADDFFVKIENTFDVATIEGEVTDEMKSRAVSLEKSCRKLHRGDNYILAYAEAVGTVLVTCDRGLASAAESIGVATINPDLLASDPSGRGVQSKLQKMSKNTIRRQVRKVVPNDKIIWRSFN